MYIYIYICAPVAIWLKLMLISNGYAPKPLSLRREQQLSLCFHRVVSIMSSAPGVAAPKRARGTVGDGLYGLPSRCIGGRD